MFNDVTTWFLFLVAIFTAILPDLFLKTYEETNLSMAFFSKNNIDKNNGYREKSQSVLGTKRKVNVGKENLESNFTSVPKKLVKSDSDVLEMKISDDEKSMQYFNNQV